MQLETAWACLVGRQHQEDVPVGQETSLHTREPQVAIHYQQVRSEMEKVTSIIEKQHLERRNSDLHLRQERAASVLQFTVHIPVLSEFTAVLGVVSQCLQLK